MTTYRDWSVTASANTGAASAGLFKENMAYSEVNNAAREFQAVLARDRKDKNGSIVASGSTSSYVLSLSSDIGSYIDGDYVRFKANVKNAGATTLRFASLSDRPVVKTDLSALEDGDIRAGGIYEAFYNSASANFQLLNPTGALAPRTIAQGGTSATSATQARAQLHVPSLAGSQTISGVNTFSGTLNLKGGVRVGNASLSAFVSTVLPFASNAETLAGTASDKAVTPVNLLYRMNPAGTIYRNATQGPITVEAQIEFNATDFNALLRGAFDVSTNFRYTATAACRVLAIAHVYFTDLDSGDEATLTLKRSGTAVGIATLRNDSGTNGLSRSLTVSRIISLTAGQYLEAFLTADTDGVTISAGVAYNSLQILELN